MEKVPMIKNSDDRNSDNYCESETARNNLLFFMMHPSPKFQNLAANNQQKSQAQVRLSDSRVLT